MKQKIFTLEILSKILSKEKAKRKKIIHCHGVFDLLHVGHIKHFAEAKSLGNILVVTITPDIYVNKGPNRPAFNEKLRAEAIAALGIVDYVALNESQTAVNAIKRIKPNIYCKGPEYQNSKNDTTGQIKNEINVLKKNSGKIYYTKSITFSSSALINKYTNFNSDLQKLSIKKIKKNYTFSKIKNLIDDFKKLKVLIVGESIIDQYVFCDALGKSGKESMLVLRDLKTEQYLGGAAAISRHVSQFCSKITLLSMIGEKAEFLKEIKNNLPKNIKFEYIKKKNSPTIVKKRFLDHINNNKVLGVYKINDDALSEVEEKLFGNKLKKLLQVHDLVIVSDYGHGLISKKNSEIICKNSNYLALNAQVNAANVGYHSMRKYKNIDCVIINEKEIRHEFRNRSDSIKLLMKKLSSQQKIRNLVVTRGVNGSILYNKNKSKFMYSDAFAKKTVDKVGAGDAMLSLIALSLKSKFDARLSLLTGSLAAAQSVETVGNKEAINKIKILKTIEHLFK